MSIPVQNVIRQPLVTEKAFAVNSAENVYVFAVDRRANKNQIQRAVEKMFNVEVLNVRTLIMRGKSKRFGTKLGKRPNWKKAYVQIAAGQTIPVFEGS